MVSSKALACVAGYFHSTSIGVWKIKHQNNFLGLVIWICTAHQPEAQARMFFPRSRFGLVCKKASRRTELRFSKRR